MRSEGNRFTERFGIAYPVVQGPLGGFRSQKLTATVSNFGGLGSLVIAPFVMGPERSTGANRRIAWTR